jgi:gliding motility-associated-like protein
MRLKYLLALIFAICLTTVSFSQLSTKHYVPPIAVSSLTPVQQQYIYISTPNNDNVGYTVTYLGTTFTETGVVSNGNPVELEIKNPITGAVDFDADSQFVVSNGLNLTNTVLSDRGFIIEAQDVVYVSVRVRAASTFHAGALVSKGQSALGNEFRVGGFISESITGSFQTFYSFTATENNTNVTIDTNGSILNVNLNEDESYIGSFDGGNGVNPNDIVGTLIQSDKPIVVNSGSLNGSFTDPGLGSDYGFDQIVDASKIGSEYIFVRGNGPTLDDNGVDASPWENVLIIAHQDNTDVFVNGETLPIANLNAGQWTVIEGDNFDRNTENMYVQTSNPVFAYQGIAGINTISGGNFPAANQGMFFVPPLSCENRGDVNNIAQIDNIGFDVFTGGISIVTNAGSTITVSQDGVNRPIGTGEGPFPVLGNNDYVTYKLNGLQGNVTVTSTGELYCAYFNQDGAATTGSFYSGFPSPPEITFSTNVAALGNCIPNVTLTAANSGLFDSLEWFFDDGSGFVSTGNMTGTIVPSQAGNYRLVGTLSCSGSTFESQSIPVSLCPDDLDGDLIIDNLDVDSDNDGILDCDESRGNVNIDFTDTNQPILNFLDGANDNTFITVTDPGTNITGDANSNFTSTLAAGPAISQTYTLAFDSPSNIELTQTPGTTHNIVNGETFTLSIGPNTKNLTLVDPDNILILDADFDGFYETEDTNISSSVIRFRFNPTPDGTTPFRFVANSVDQISLVHDHNNITDNSVLEVNLILTCFGIDTDNDGIVNAFDADSDNDGIPDLMEAQGGFFQLLGTDADLDGLDDAFGGVPVPAVDSDGDGVLDIIDLDSDNDGIYDLFEARHGLPDANLDGRIDNAINLVGMNGWVNSLETAPDNFLIAYDINGAVGNMDGDAQLNYVDLESDGDLCPDVIEAGFDDPDADNSIGTSPVTVDAEGKVTGIADGYTVPNSDWETGAPIELNVPFEDVAFCDESTGVITIDSTADTFQWELSTDGGANWVTLTDDATYSGVNGPSLSIANINPSFAGHQFRVQLQRLGNSCDDVSNAVSLTVEPLPVVMTAELRQCDDDTDGFSIFNLFEASENISINAANETFEFFETEADAENGVNQIANPTAYTNEVASSDTVWARAISAFGCSEVAQLNLIVATSSTVVTNFPPRTLTTCDDFLDEDGNDTANNDDTDGISFFDIDITTELINQFPANERPDLTINYYPTLADAQSEINRITNLTNYRNIGFPGGHQIFVRVDNVNNNECIGFAPLITLVVDPVPVAIGVDDLELCDDINDGDGFNGIVQSFNLDAQTPLILGATQSETDFTVTYHTSAADALAGINAIASTAAYTNIVPSQQTIYVRVTNNTTNCFTNHTSFDLIVNQLPVANPVPDLEVCDDDLDGSARNGFSQQFDLELQTAGILLDQDPNQFQVTYHSSIDNALAGINPLGSPFSNSVPFSQEIFVRVTNGDSGCANGITSFNVIVNPEPTTREVSNLSFCDDDADGDDTNGIVQNIILNDPDFIRDILAPDQSPDDFTVTFHETQQNATDGVAALSSPYSNTIADQQTIYVRVENNATGCVNDDFTFDVIVNPLPDFEVTTPQIVCLNGPELIISAENPLAVYDYVWQTPSGNMRMGQSINIASGGLYSVTATTTDGTGCSRTLEIQVDESIIATITDNDVTIVDDSENNSIAIDPTNLGIGDYEFALTDEMGIVIRNYQDAPLFENLEGGFYTILVRDKNGCGVASLDVSVVEFPKFFTPNNDGFNDTWIIKGANSFFFPDSEVNIFNRFGKVVAKINIDEEGWDGTLNGRLLPSDDYWFNIRLVDRNGVLRQRQGNFSLLRK